MIIGIIQARMGSTRLPGKALKKVDGRPLFKYMIERVSKLLLIDRIVITTTTLKKELKKKKSFGYLNEIIDLIDSNENIKSLNGKWVGLEKYWF